ncbi:hypothetical protein BS50DRAFT_253335 [Corynespora cassiicola Philippines]|uniref:Uncharacterized protein n=1 Tax=Corynespora cassiicola Philippines TaxID=1448308 RepID=A0A2T2P498_CORCC|nr:hypothetical protein BS50DRAFT_253335 [Corynespora cassiicola Philippines]
MACRPPFTSLPPSWWPACLSFDTQRRIASLFLAWFFGPVLFLPSHLLFFPGLGGRASKSLAWVGLVEGIVISGQLVA